MKPKSRAKVRRVLTQKKALLKKKKLVRFKSGDSEWTVTIQELRVGAAAGNPDSQCILGAAYTYGRGVPASSRRAVHYYSLAARQGHISAICNLASCYFAGRGVRKDQPKAAKLYRKAALKGDHQAQCELGIMYRFGEGIRRNRKLALYWLRRASRNDPRALFHLGDGHENSGNGVLAMRYMRRAAALGHRGARNWLAKQPKSR
jgi:TPR repeat protein